MLGLGNVGVGVVRGLEDGGDLLANRTGVKLALKRVAVRDLAKPRDVKVPKELLTTDPSAVVADPDVEVVLELMGGTDVARTCVLEALAAGKPVVTANKALLAEFGDEIFTAAENSQAGLHYEASVAGGIPVIRALREGLIANHIVSLHGILNGTCNYILTRMEKEGLEFNDVLREAQASGYAEADPGLDIDGIDTAHKLCILASLAYGFPVPFKSIYVEGIRGLDRMDIRYADELGYCIKLLGVIRHDPQGIEVRVHPSLVAKDHMLASVSSVFNAVMVHGDIVDRTLYYGRGAGPDPTASAVISDLADVARDIASHGQSRLPAFVSHDHYGALRPIEESKLRCYLHLSLLDRPGVLARVAETLGRHDISIASMIQAEERQGEMVPVVIITHAAREASFVQAIREIDNFKDVGRGTVRIRIEDFS